MKIIILEKLAEAPDPKHPNNIPVGEIHEGMFRTPPTVGDAFWVGFHWRTSPVVEILSDNTFRTLNSIYKWTVKET
jgi:hypothetical protein